MGAILVDTRITRERVGGAHRDASRSDRAGGIARVRASLAPLALGRARGAR